VFVIFADSKEAVEKELSGLVVRGTMTINDTRNDDYYMILSQPEGY